MCWRHDNGHTYYVCIRIFLLFSCFLLFLIGLFNMIDAFCLFAVELL